MAGGLAHIGSVSPLQLPEPRSPKPVLRSSSSPFPFCWGGGAAATGENAYFGGLLALTVDDDDAFGRIIGQSSFMGLRSQRTARIRFSDVVHDDDQPIETATDVHPYYVVGDLGAQLAISLQVPHCPSSRSWANLTYTDPDADQQEFRIRQFGPRKLWDEVEAAYRWWADAGSPAVDRWRFTVTPEGQRVELDP
ncbi:MAG: hypothetical protein M3R63_19035 [Actinomycetota bacterium]|nr:hypothetical protein [Actinomycetota bacterium]